LRPGLSVPANGEVIMPKKPSAHAEYVLFDVVYEDGTQRSNRKVPGELLGGLDGDEPAQAEIEAQDRAIAEKSRMPPLSIKSIRRSGAKKP
jgi:hypothetical protein